MTNKELGFQLWCVVLKNYNIDAHKALKGIYMAHYGKRMQLYFDEDLQKWLMRPLEPNLN